MVPSNPLADVDATRSIGDSGLKAPAYARVYAFFIQLIRPSHGNHACAFDLRCLFPFATHIREAIMTANKTDKTNLPSRHVTELERSRTV